VLCVKGGWGNDHKIWRLHIKREKYARGGEFEERKGWKIKGTDRLEVRLPLSRWDGLIDVQTQENGPVGLNAPSALYTALNASFNRIFSIDRYPTA